MSTVEAFDCLPSLRQMRFIVNTINLSPDRSLNFWSSLGSFCGAMALTSAGFKCGYFRRQCLGRAPQKAVLRSFSLRFSRYLAILAEKAITFFNCLSFGILNQSEFFWSVSHCWKRTLPWLFSKTTEWRWSNESGLHACFGKTNSSLLVAIPVVPWHSHELTFTSIYTNSNLNI